MADRAALGRRVLKPGCNGRPCYSVLQFGWWYKILLTEKGEENSDSDDCERSVTQADVVKKKKGFEVDGGPLHYIRKGGTL